MGAPALMANKSPGSSKTDSIARVRHRARPRLDAARLAGTHAIDGLGDGRGRGHHIRQH